MGEETERKKNGGVSAYKGELNALIKGVGGQTQAREDGEVDGAPSDGGGEVESEGLGRGTLDGG